MEPRLPLQIVFVPRQSQLNLNPVLEGAWVRLLKTNHARLSVMITLGLLGIGLPVGETTHHGTAGLPGPLARKTAMVEHSPDPEPAKTMLREPKLERSIASGRHFLMVLLKWLTTRIVLQ